MLKPTLAASASLLFISVCLFACSKSDASDSDSKDKTFKCEVSSAESGDLCQVNFYCDDGTEPAAYCSKDGVCDCGPKSEKPKSFTHEGICDLEMNERATVANEECGFGM